MKSSRHLFWIVGLPLLLGVLWIVWTFATRPKRIDPFPEIESVEVRWGDDPFTFAPRWPVRLKVVKRPQIERLVEVLDRAHQTHEHKCSSVARLVLRPKEGRVLDLWLLPGHDPSAYEFRDIGKGEVYRVDRTEFLAWMEEISIELPTDCCLPTLPKLTGK